MDECEYNLKCTLCTQNEKEKNRRRRRKRTTIIGTSLVLRVGIYTTSFFQFNHFQMLLWHLNLLILISFCSLSWSSMMNDNGVWPWTKTKYLTRSNWSSLLLPNSDHQPSVWFIFHYLNYCGYCKRAEPGWEAVARYALSKNFFETNKILHRISFSKYVDWSKYIQIGAYDCASESVISNNEICQDEKYPQWRIYCPVTNSTQLAFLSERRTNNTTAEEILIWLIEKINDIADQCYGKSWPVRSILE